MKKEKRRRRFSRWLLLPLCALLLGGAGFGVYRGIAHIQQVKAMEAAVYVDTFYAGTSIGGVAVGGLSQREAREKVEAALAVRYAGPAITITHEGGRWAYTQYDLLDRSGMDAVWADAWALCRTGELTGRYRGVTALKAYGRDFPLDISFDGEAIGGDLAAIAESVDIAARNARIEYCPGEEPAYALIRESVGRRVDTGGTLALVRYRIMEHKWGDIPLMVDTVAPEVTLDDLVIVDFATSIAGNTANRAHNVRLALSNIDGYVLGPGEMFSFNEAVGNRTTANGFRPAPVINGDKALVMGIGGGTCQASTTTYNAALWAGMEIEERHHHSFPVGYIDKGLDATVSWGTQDVKFVNPRDTPVCIHTYFENDNVHVVIWGEPMPRDGEIRCWSEVTGTVAPPIPAVRDDGSLTPGQSVSYVKSRAGYRVTAYREYYESGELVERSVLHEDYYRPIRGVVLRGPEAAAPPPSVCE